MTLMDALNLFMRLSFVAIATLTLADYLRHRTLKHLDIHLMFASLAGIMIVQLVESSLRANLPWANLVGLALFLAQPYLLLRLVEHHRPIPPVVMRFALAGTIVSDALVIGMKPPYTAVLSAVIVACFVLVEGYAAWLLVEGSHKSRGVAHNRLLLASLGSAGLALVLLLAGVLAMTRQQTVNQVIQSLIAPLAVLSALCYYGGFKPPLWLLDYWQLAELHRFLRDTTGRGVRGETGEVLARLCTAAVHATGGLAAVVAIRDDKEQRYLIRAASDPRSFAGMAAIDPGMISEAWDQRRQVSVSGLSRLAAAERRLVGPAGAQALLAVPIATAERVWGGIVVLQLREPLFAEDSLQLLGLFAEQAAMALAYADMLAEQRALVVQFRESNVRLARATQMKSEFLANMSHELRTPLNAIIGFTELMHDGAVGPVSAEHKEYLGDIMTSAHHLLQIINDVLDLAKVEAGKMEFRPELIDAGRLVGEVRDVLWSLAMHKRIAVNTEVDPALPAVVIDPAKLKQVLYNYLSNALKFTPEEGQITVRVRPEDETAFRLEVEDTGIGISPDQLGELFQEFKQLDAGRRKRYQGTGLGLALTRRIVEAQGGRVGAESTPGKGSRFYAVLPHRPDAQTEPAPRTYAAPSAPVPGKPTILVVEDEQTDLDWVVHTLTGHGYAVDIAMNGAEAVAKVNSRAYSAVTLDMLLPDMSGLDVLRAIRGGALNPNVPVILVTVVAEKGAVGGFRIHDHLVKPLQPEDLLVSLERAGVRPSPTAAVLVIDDDPVSLRLMEAALTQLGCRPVCRSSGEAGLQAAAEHRPAAIILDLTMPEMDGFDFLARFRATPGGGQTPVIIWTARDLSVVDLERLKLSAQGVVLKRQGRMDVLLAELRAVLAPAGS